MENGNYPEGEKVVKAWKHAQRMWPRITGLKGVNVRKATNKPECLIFMGAAQQPWVP